MGHCPGGPPNNIDWSKQVSVVTGQVGLVVAGADTDAEYGRAERGERTKPMQLRGGGNVEQYLTARWPFPRRCVFGPGRQFVHGHASLTCVVRLSSGTRDSVTEELPIRLNRLGMNGRRIPFGGPMHDAECES